MVRTTAQVAFQRVSQELRAGAMQVDVLSSTDIGHYVYLKEKQLLEQFVPENAGKVLEIYQHYDPDGYYFVTSAGLIGMVLGALGLRYVAVAAGLAILAGGAGALVALVAGRSRKTAIPFGPFLVAGAAAAAFWGSHIAHAYLSTVR